MNQDNELLMYRVMSILAENGAPFLFKGGLITKVYLDEYNLGEIARKTKDIDANWVGSGGVDEVVKCIDNAVKTIDSDFEAVYNRVSSEETSGRVVVRDANSKISVFSMDIDFVHLHTTVSAIEFDGQVIKCVGAKDIIADKISSISSPMIFRRSKDMLDLYAFSMCIGFSTREIKEIAKHAKHTIGDFVAFLTQKDELKHAYGKLIAGEEKPDFETVYCQLKRIIEPFRSERDQVSVWNPMTLDYDDVHIIENKEIEIDDYNNGEFDRYSDDWER